MGAREKGNQKLGHWGEGTVGSWMDLGVGAGEKWWLETGPTTQGAQWLGKLRAGERQSQKCAKLGHTFQEAKKKKKVLGGEGPSWKPSAQ